MQELVYEVLVDWVVMVLASLGAGLLTVLGLLLERAGLASLTAGEVALGSWYLYMGGLALFVGVYLLGYREVRPRVTSLRRRADDGAA